VIRRTLVWIALAANIGGCGKGSEPTTATSPPAPKPPPVATVSVFPPTTELIVGAVQQLTATLLDATGAPLTGRTVTWASSDQTKAQVDANGLVSALATGAATISASSESRSGSATVTIAAGAPVASASLIALSAPAVVRTGSLSVSVTVRNGASANIVTASPSDFSVTSSSGTLTSFACVNGVCTATLAAPTEAGTLTLSVQVAGVHVSGSPAVVRVHGNANGSLVLGSDHTCGLSATGPLYCWGNLSWLPGVALSPGQWLQSSSPYVAAASEYRQVCGITSGSLVFCMGENGTGQVGNGTTTATQGFAPLNGALALPVLAAGVFHTCGLTSAGEAYCWGQGGTLTPSPVSGSLRFVALDAGMTQSCGLTPTGSAYCWGQAATSPPTAVPGGQSFVAIAAGWWHTCALTGDGSAYCWGQNDKGQLGDGTTSNRTTPGAVSGSVRFRSITAGYGHTCGIAVDGATYCWGQNDYGQLGDGTATNKWVPTIVGGSRAFVSVTAGVYHTCGVITGGIGYCWGDNANGQLGDGTRNHSVLPVAIAGGLTFKVP
jgi:hypothetical protein